MQLACHASCMPTPEFVVTFNRRSDVDIAGLRRMSLREADALLAFAALRGMIGARILPAEHAAACLCSYCPVLAVAR